MQRINKKIIGLLLVALIVVVIGIFTASISPLRSAWLVKSLPSQPILQVEVVDQADFESRLLEIINDKRQELDLATLITNTVLMQVAEAHSQDMADRNYLEHGSPEGNHLGWRLDEVGYSWYYWGEVIAGGSVSAEETLKGWLDSPRHKVVLLDPAYTEIGVGYVAAAKETKYHHYWTVVFAIPKGEN